MFHVFNQIFPYAAILVACACAVVTDVRSKIIPNPIPIALVILALIYQSCHGFAALCVSIAAIMVVLLLGSYAFKFRWLGGGDIKLIAAGCAFLPLTEQIDFVLFTAIGGGLLAIVTAMAAGNLQKTLASSITILHGITIDPTMRIAPQTQTKIPYAIAIAFGAVLLTIMHSVNPVGLRLFLT